MSEDKEVYVGAMVHVSTGVGCRAAVVTRIDAPDMVTVHVFWLQHDYYDVNIKEMSWLQYHDPGRPSIGLTWHWPEGSK